MVASTNVPGSILDILNSPFSCFTRSLIPLIPTPDITSAPVSGMPFPKSNPDSDNPPLVEEIYPRILAAGMPEDVGKRLLPSPKVGLTYSAPSRNCLGWALTSESSCGSKYLWHTDDTVRPPMIEPPAVKVNLSRLAPSKQKSQSHFLITGGSLRNECISRTS